MKLYFTITDGIEKSKVNLDMLRLACKSAKENTSLDIYALYDGHPTDSAYKILTEFGAKIKICSCSFSDKLKKYYPLIDNSNSSSRNGIKRLLGCFMKFDIMKYETDDNIVLYADIDTIFLKDANWNSFYTNTIAVAPEISQKFDIIKGHRYFSASPMLINVANAKKKLSKLFFMLDNKLTPYQECWDQGFWNELYKDDFETLPIEFNWKPYWGINNDAYIVHFHGFKLGAELTEEDSVFCTSIMIRFPYAYEGWLYYTMLSYKFLKYNKEIYIVKLAVFLNKCLNKSIYKNNKQWYLSTFVLYFIYKHTRNKKGLTNQLHQYTQNKLKKRRIAIE